MEIKISKELIEVYNEAKNNKYNFTLKDFKYDLERVTSVQCCGDYCVNATPYCKVENCPNYAIFDTETADEADYSKIDGQFNGIVNNGVWLCQQHLIEWSFYEDGRYEGYEDPIENV